MKLRLGISLLMVLSAGLPTAFAAKNCRTLEGSMENSFLMNGDQRAEILNLLAQKDPGRIEEYKILLRKLPKRGLVTGDFLDFMRRSAPEEVMDVMRRLASEDVSKIFLQRLDMSRLSVRDRVFLDVVINNRWRSYKGEAFLRAADGLAKYLTVSTYVDLAFKNRKRKVGNTILENQLYQMADDYLKLESFGRISVHFDSIDNMKAELRIRAKELLEDENAATGLNKIHLRKDRITIETYLRLLDSKGKNWAAESKALVEQQWDDSRRWFLTYALPRSPVMANVDRAGYLASSVAFGMLLYFVSDNIVEWMHPPFEVEFDDKLEFDKNDIDRELTPDEEQKIQDGLKAGRKLEDIFSEMFGDKKN